LDHTQSRPIPSQSFSFSISSLSPRQIVPFLFSLHP